MTPDVPCCQLPLGPSVPQPNHKPSVESPKVWHLSAPALGPVQHAHGPAQILLEGLTWYAQLSHDLQTGDGAKVLLGVISQPACDQGRRAELSCPLTHHPSEGHAKGLAVRTPFSLSVEFHSCCQEPESWLCLSLILPPCWKLDSGCRFYCAAASGLCAAGVPAGRPAGFSPCL